MAETPYPIPRGERVSEILNGNGGRVYGPFTFKIFNIDDVEVIVRPLGAISFSVEAVNVQKVSGAPLDFFTIAFLDNLPVTSSYQVRGVRIARRSAGVMKGTRLNPDALENELSKTSLEMQEVRRDITPVDPSVQDGDTVMLWGGRFRKGASAADIALAQSYSEAALLYRNAAAIAADRAEYAAAGLFGLRYSDARENVTSDTNTFDANAGGPLNLKNTAYGDRALHSLANGAENVAIGSRALRALTGASGTNNANGNTAVGTNALADVTVMDFNTGIGSNAGRSITTGGGNTALGHGAMGADDFVPAPATGFYNTMLGSWTGQELTTGGGNTGVGMNSCMNITTGQQNSALGIGALAGTVNETATAVGNGASFNVAIGGYALQASQSDGNTAVGFWALRRNTTGTMSVAVGLEALKESTADVGNSAVGYGSMALNNGGDYNSALGRFAMNRNLTGSNNVAVGDSALYNNQNGSELVAVGSGALYSVTGSLNTGIGRNAGSAITSGQRNTIVGAYAGAAFATGSNNTAVGVEAGGGSDYSNATTLGYQAGVTGNNQVQLGNSATTTYVYGTVQNRSDERDKADIRDTILGLDFILALRPVDYRWDMRDDYIERNAETGGVIRKERDGSRKRKRFHHGFSAQEIAALEFEFGGLQDHSKDGGDDVLSVGYDEFIAPVVCAIQQSHKLTVDLREDVDQLKDRVTSLEEWRRAA